MNSRFETMGSYSFDGIPRSYHRSSPESDTSSHHSPTGGESHTGSQFTNAYGSQSPLQPYTPFSHVRGGTYSHGVPGSSYEFQYYQEQPEFYDPHNDFSIDHPYEIQLEGVMHPMPGHHSPPLPRRVPQSPSIRQHPSPFQSSGVSPRQLSLNEEIGSSSPAMEHSIPDLTCVENKLRSELHFNDHTPLSLASIPDPGPNIRPSYTLSLLVQLAIVSSPLKKLTLQELYATLEARFAYFRNHSHKDASWKGSIRHMLSLHKEFQKVARDVSEPGKGAYWEVVDSVGYKRRRVRASRAKVSHQPRSEDEDFDYESSPSPTTTRSGRAVRSPYNAGSNF